MILNLAPAEMEDIVYFLNAFCHDEPEGYDDEEFDFLRGICNVITESVKSDETNNTFIPTEFSVREAQDIEYYLGELIFHECVWYFHFPYIEELRAIIKQAITDWTYPI